MKMLFGLHEGKELEDVPTDYLEYLLLRSRNGIRKDELKKAVQDILGINDNDVAENDEKIEIQEREDYESLTAMRAHVAINKEYYTHLTAKYGHTV